MLAEKYGADFPLFDKGHLKYREKSGEFVTKEEIDKILNTSRTFRKIKSELESATATVDSIGTLGRFVSGLIDLTDQITETSSILKITKETVKFFDAVVAKRAEEAKKKNDIEFAEIQKELAVREKAPDSYALMEYLPRLFTRDLTDWLEETDSKLLIFFDTYEILTEDEKDSKRHVKLMSINQDVEADWWIKDYIDDNMPGLINIIPRVLWIFAGRNELTWAKKWAEDDDFQQFNLDSFSPDDSKKFLEKVGITDSEIVDGIIKLTGGSPMWLKLCGEIYNTQTTNGKIPTIEDFGKKREDIVKRLLNYMDADAKKTLQYLCIFGRWTDETASRIIPAYNAETYKRVKTFSLIRSDDDKVLKMFSFDRTTRNILLPYLAESPEHRVMFEEIGKSADKYFNEFFEKQLQIGRNKNRRKPFYGNEKAHTYFEIWAEIISETSFEPEEFMSRYEEHLSKFINLFDIYTRESVAEKFFIKVKKFNNPQSAPYAYFEHCFGAVKFARQNYSDALILAESAYDKFKRLELAENELKYKIAVTKGLADIYDKLQYYKKEIDLREEILKISRRIFKPADNENIIDAMKDFADALENGDRKSEC